jgi:tripeptide aminopeptidase
MEIRQRVLERFLEYVQIDTGSDENATDRAPSTERQYDLLRRLEAELKALGLHEITLHKGGVLTAMLPANSPKLSPVVGFVAHVDVYPNTPNTGVKPVVHSNYDGRDLVLPGAPARPIKVAENPGLLAYKGDAVITSDGTTLLGADDKAGVAEIMTALEYLGQHPEVKHGEIMVAFTPDEEIGRGTENFPDLKDFGADVAYTVDGGEAGEIENETFCADSAQLKLVGRDVHPGYAKGKMVNAIRAAARVIELLPRDALPESTEGQQPYLHPLGISGDVNGATINFIVRSFTMKGLEDQETTLAAIVETVKVEFPGLEATLEVRHSYKNMKVYLDKDPRVMDLAIEAIQACGIKPLTRSIRGGTDGARLSEKGLLTPNLFAGGRNFHSVQEWVPLADMEGATRVILKLAELWHLKG